MLTFYYNCFILFYFSTCPYIEVFFLVSLRVVDMIPLYSQILQCVVSYKDILLHQWFSKYGSRASSNCITWKHVIASTPTDQLTLIILLWI